MSTTQATTTSKYTNYPISFIQNIYWSAKEKLEYLQRRVIVSSIAYYDLDDNYISDTEWAELAKQLVWYQKEYAWEVEETRYWYVTKDFDGSTGYSLCENLDNDDKVYLTQIAEDVLAVYKKRGR